MKKKLLRYIFSALVIFSCLQCSAFSVEITTSDTTTLIVHIPIGGVEITNLENQKAVIDRLRVQFNEIDGLTYYFLQLDTEVEYIRFPNNNTYTIRCLDKTKKPGINISRSEHWWPYQITTDAKSGISVEIAGKGEYKVSVLEDGAEVKTRWPAFVVPKDYEDIPEYHVAYAEFTATCTPDTKVEWHNKGIIIRDIGNVKVSYAYQIEDWIWRELPTGRVVVKEMESDLENISVWVKAEDESVYLHPFEDVTLTDWHVSSVDKIMNAELMTGTGETYFSPGENMNRAMLVTVLHRLTGLPDTEYRHTFTDVVDSAYYHAAVCWGTQTGIINGYSSTNFAPNDFVTREQIAALLYRYSEYLGVSTERSGGANLSAFTDGDEVSPYAEEAVSWAVDNELLTGYENGSLSPKGLATRAEVATILMRFIEG